MKNMLSTEIEQWGFLDEFTDAFKSNSEAVFIIIITWFGLMIILQKFLHIRVTPWIALMCLILSFLLGFWYINAFLI